MRSFDIDDDPWFESQFHLRIDAITTGMEHIAIKLLGFAAATCTSLAFAPQFVKVWRSRSTEDISLGMFFVMVLGVMLWLLYGLFTGDAPLIASNAITIVLAGGILFMKLKYG
jgi:MtN3 and saliva related transmembrane protein